MYLDKTTVWSLCCFHPLSGTPDFEDTCVYLFSNLLSLEHLGLSVVSITFKMVSLYALLVRMFVSSMLWGYLDVLLGTFEGVPFDQVVLMCYWGVHYFVSLAYGSYSVDSL